MGGYFRTQTASRRYPRSVTRELAVASGPRPAVLLAVLAAAAVLMSAPALVVALSMLDSNLINSARDWASGLTAGLASLAHARVVLYVPLLAMVARASENQ